jgi:hypothetical protein
MSRYSARDTGRQKRVEEERLFMYKRWRSVIKNYPYYNTNLTISCTDYVPTTVPRPEHRKGLYGEIEIKKGINILGYFNGIFGLAKSGRIVHQLLESLSISTSLFELSSSEHGHDNYVVPDNTLPYAVNIVCCNPDRDLDIPLMADKYMIGFWYWELEQVPQNGKTLPGSLMSFGWHHNLLKMFLIENFQMLKHFS